MRATLSWLGATQGLLPSFFGISCDVTVHFSFFRSLVSKVSCDENIHIFTIKNVIMCSFRPIALHALHHVLLLELMSSCRALIEFKVSGNFVKLLAPQQVYGKPSPFPFLRNREGSVMTEAAAAHDYADRGRCCSK